MEWFKMQGLSGEYDTNAGRKSLARWLEKLQVPYEDAVEIHGDLECVFRRYYQPGLPQSGYALRNQTNDPDKACQALRKFALFCGRGQKPYVKLDITQRLLKTLLEKDGRGDEAMKAIYGLPT